MLQYQCGVKTKFGQKQVTLILPTKAVHGDRHDNGPRPRPTCHEHLSEFPPLVEVPPQYNTGRAEAYSRPHRQNPAVDDEQLIHLVGKRQEKHPQGTDDAPHHGTGPGALLLADSGHHVSKGQRDTESHRPQPDCKRIRSDSHSTGQTRLKPGQTRKKFR